MFDSFVRGNVQRFTLDHFIGIDRVVDGKNVPYVDFSIVIPVSFLCRRSSNNRELVSKSHVSYFSSVYFLDGFSCKFNHMKLGDTNISCEFNIIFIVSLYLVGHRDPFVVTIDLDGQDVLEIASKGLFRR